MNGPYVLGIDQSEMGTTGYALVRGQSLVHSGIFDYGKVKESRRRLDLYAIFLRDVLHDWKPEVIVLEQVRQFHQDGINIHTIRKLSELIGATKLVCDLYYNPDIPIWLVNTSSWKAAVIGTGWNKAGKEASVTYAKQVFGLDVTHDEGDAICMALYGASYIRLCQPPQKNIMELVS